MDMLLEKWDKIAEDYPGIDNDAVLNRTLHRTFWTFGEAVKQGVNAEEGRNIVFPAYFFDAPRDELAIYARHLYAGLWHDSESVFEKTVRQRLMYLSKKTNKILLCVGTLSGLNLLGLLGVFLLLK